ncbi:hypothetical protein [Nonomuraea jabiensis]|uniref:hypothetical protein n=1 Tax=Nonomuraea jabiensis TaxID=882448 RepID=UPI003D72C038
MRALKITAAVIGMALLIFGALGILLAVVLVIVAVWIAIGAMAAPTRGVRIGGRYGRW